MSWLAKRPAMTGEISVRIDIAEATRILTAEQLRALFGGIAEVLVADQAASKDTIEEPNHGKNL